MGIIFGSYLNSCLGLTYGNWELYTEWVDMRLLTGEGALYSCLSGKLMLVF